MYIRHYLIDLSEKIGYNNDKSKNGGYDLKILVVFTGGTIGSSIYNGYAVPDSEKKYKLIDMYQKSTQENIAYQTKEKVEFDMESPYQELSENNTGAQIFTLASYLNEKTGEDCKYDGIIITHGTDTLQYTAAALGYMFGDTDIPIVIVSSNYVLDDVRANGLTNFAYAVKFIEGKYGTGVYVSYCNTGREPVIHRGTRLMEHTAYSDDVYSIKNSEYGIFEDGIFTKNLKETANYVFLESTKICSEIRERFLKEEKTENIFSDIVLVKPFPGMRYNVLPNGTKAVIHTTYHSGTMCSKSLDLKVFADDARERNIPVYIYGTGESVDYDSVKVFEKFGFELLQVAALPAMLMKLWIASVIFSDRNEISEFMMRDVSGDINLNI